MNPLKIIFLVLFFPIWCPIVMITFAACRGFQMALVGVLEGACWSADVVASLEHPKQARAALGQPAEEGGKS